ncbi:hypothetical protein D3C84_913880 [compost metagenome]
MCLLPLAFGLVHGGIGRGVDDNIRLQLANGVAQALEVGEVAAQAIVAMAVGGDQFAQWRQRALQFPADLAVLAEQENFHA